MIMLIFVKPHRSPKSVSCNVNVLTTKTNRETNVYSVAVVVFALTCHHPSFIMDIHTQRKLIEEKIEEKKARSPKNNATQPSDNQN